jgi:hypothetical protein
MQGRIAIICHGALTRALFYSLVLFLGCAIGGCNAEPGAEKGPSAVPPGIENMKDQMKNQMKQQNRAKGRMQPGGPQGR